MKGTMLRKLSQIVFITMVFAAAGCVKDTYDMNKLSGKVHLSPTVAISAVNGTVSLSDMIKSGDTVVFDQNNFVKLVFKKDSVVNLKLFDFYDLTNMVAFNQSYAIGELNLDPFSSNLSVNLGQITAILPPADKAKFTGLDNGATHPWPGFPSIALGDKTFTGITNFETAVFKSGYIDITIKNNLPAKIDGLTLNLLNTVGRTAIGGTVTMLPIQPGQTGVASVDLTDKTVTNSIIAAIVLSGSTASATPVIISMNNNGIQVTITGRSLVVKSGRVKLPNQAAMFFSNKDTINFDPGNGAELSKLQTISGNITYHIVSTSSLTASLAVSMPTAIRGGAAVSKTINVGPNLTIDGSIPFDNTLVDLSTAIKQPFNRIPITYNLSVNSNNSIVTFNSTDKVQFEMKFLNPVFDYVKGYFGQRVESISPDSINLDIKDVLSHITGDFLISNPSIKINYSNSFDIPLLVTLNGTGVRTGKTKVDLGLAPFNINPATFTARDVTGLITVDKLNSSLPTLISLPPEVIRFSGSAKMNPAGNNGLRDNYVFGTSRFLGSVEVEVPLEFRTNLQFVDTINNFLKTSGSSSFKPEDFKLLRVDLNAKNGFPVGISLKMSLYDPVTKTIKSTVDATDLLLAAPIDSNGKSNGTTETNTKIEFTQEFFSAINKADKIILTFGMKTTQNGTKDVRIYSDNSIEYNAALVAQPDINVK